MPRMEWESDKKLFPDNVCETLYKIYSESPCLPLAKVLLPDNKQVGRYITVEEIEALKPIKNIGDWSAENMAKVVALDQVIKLIESDIKEEKDVIGRMSAEFKNNGLKLK